VRGFNWHITPGINNRSKCIDEFADDGMSRMYRLDPQSISNWVFHRLGKNPLLIQFQVFEILFSKEPLWLPQIAYAALSQLFFPFPL